tara:strand:- start:404 stop:1222 length:819 start_codon:yes stop_codon:yes gene_type:complete
MTDAKGELNSDPKVSVILPTYNESENIGPLIDDITDLLNNRDYEIIVVDDNSPDGTMNIVEEKKKHNRRLHLVCRTDRRGLTSALNDGIAHARGEIVLWMDCDFQMPPSVVPELVEKVENGYDAAIGSRFIEEGADLRHKDEPDSKGLVSFHRYLSKLICSVTSRVFQTEHTDWTSGFIAIRKEIFDRIDLFGDYGEYFMYLVHHLIKSGYRLVEVPYVLLPRRSGESKTSDSYLGMIAKGVKYLSAILRLKLLDKLYYSVYGKDKHYYERG